MKSSIPPKEYLDGCTLFPNQFGKISHRSVCHEHDLDYWRRRTLLGKIYSDFKWFFGILNIHVRRNNWYWIPIVVVCAIIGLMGLLTFGWVPWTTRHFWDTRDKNQSVIYRIRKFFEKED